MRHSLLPRLLRGAIPVFLAGTLCACIGPDPAPQGQAGPAREANPAPAPPAGDGLPPAEAPAANEFTECPYLDSQWVADTNGQRMTQVGIDTRFATPACIFWSYPEDPQATVLVRELADAPQARAVVDWAAPVDETELAEFDGWSGGRGAFTDSAVFAVQKDNRAVVVWTNQLQSVKAELIAKEAIKNLSL